MAEYRKKKQPGSRWVAFDPDKTGYDWDTYSYKRDRPEPGPESVSAQVRLDGFPDAGYTTSVEIHNTTEGPRIVFVGVGMAPTPGEDHDKAFPFYSDNGWLQKDGKTGEVLNRNGVTARLLKKLNHTAILKAALVELAEEDPYDYPVVDEAIAQIMAGLKGSRTQTRDDAFKANLAAAYVGEVAATGGRGVYKRLAVKLDYSEHTLRSYVQQLRSEGFLSAGRPGAAGGELTDKTKKILSEGAKKDG